MKKILKSYFFWTYPRGCFHYDVMVTVILLFIFVTPHLWDYGDKPAVVHGATQPMQVIANDGHELIITVQAADVYVGAADSDRATKKALRKAIEPLTGDAVWLERWELSRDEKGNPLAWKVWAHR
jgi:hypothetical protein